MNNFTKTLLVSGFALLGSQAAQAQQLLDNFESTRLLDYPTPQGTLTVVPNPGSSAANTSTSCASYVRDGSQQYAVVNAVVKNGGKFANVSAYAGATATKRISMKFRSAAPAGTAVQLVLQNRAKNIVQPYNYPQGNFAVFNATTAAAANTWETLTFTYASGGADPSVTANDIDQMAILVAPNSNGSATYYIDDLTGPELVTLATRQAQTSTAALGSPYPNPAAGVAHLPFSLRQSATVSLALYDQLGRRVAQVLDGKAYPAGDQSAEIQTNRLAAGLYTCRLTVDGAVLSSQLSVE